MDSSSSAAYNRETTDIEDKGCNHNRGSLADRVLTVVAVQHWGKNHKPKVSYVVGQVKLPMPDLVR